MSQELTTAEISQHAGKRDLYLIVHEKVYNVTSFVDEHPGGEEVLLDVGGQDSTDAFEDVGHSDEAREILEGLLIGTVKRLPGEAKPKPTATNSFETTTKTESGSSFMTYLIVIIGVATAYFAYSFTQAAQQ